MSRFTKRELTVIENSLKMMIDRQKHLAVVMHQIVHPEQADQAIKLTQDVLEKVRQAKEEAP